VTDNDNSGFSGGAQQIRETVKWLIASFGAIGAALIAGSQLSGIGKLRAGDLRLWVSMGGIASGLSGVGIAIWAAIAVLTPEEVTLSDLAACRSHDLATAVDRQSTIFEGEAASVRELDARYRQALAERAVALKASVDAVASDTADARAHALDIETKHLSMIVQNVLAVASWYQLKAEFQRARTRIFFGGATTAVSVAIFVWSANPPR
jgi:hypothetical protein